MSIYENRRILFEGILKKYNDYLDLYRSFNNGSIVGATPFDQFYWDYTYYSKFSLPQSGSQRV